MDTASFQFVFFGLAVALLSNLSRARAWRLAVLILASLVFLGVLAHSATVLLPLTGFLLLGYLGLTLLERGWSKLWIWSILAVILAYTWLKKYTFLPESIFLDFPYFTIGLSYIFFRMLHLLIESRERGERRDIGVRAYLIYMLNFTTLISGPIQRYEEFAGDQFAPEPIPLGPRVVGLQLERIVRGFFKVNILGVLLHTMQEDSLAQLFQPVPLSLKLAAAFRLTVLYPFFVYASFSGYIDIVIALARLMRVRLPENFNRPFSASSLLDLWNRWHITLSRWLKTYVYYPLLLVLMRRTQSVALEPLLGVFCFFVTFFLVGVWHGRTSEFVFFGVLLGAGVSINKLWQLGLMRVMSRKGYKALANDPVYIALGRGLTFTWFALTNFWFWADWKQIEKILGVLGVVHWLAVWLVIWVCATAVLALWEGLRSIVLSIKTAEGPVLTNRYARVVFAAALVLVTLVISAFLSQPAPDIVYKTF